MEIITWTDNLMNGKYLNFFDTVVIASCHKFKEMENIVMEFLIVIIL